MVTLVWEPSILIDGELIVLDGKACKPRVWSNIPEIVEVAVDALIPYTQWFLIRQK